MWRPDAVSVLQSKFLSMVPLQPGIKRVSCKYGITFQPLFGCLIFFSFLLSNFNRDALAQELQSLQFTASGVVDSQYFFEGKLTHNFTNQFTCCVSNGNYSMFLAVSNGRTRSLECLFDGTNTYFTRRFSTNPVTTVSTFKNGQFFEHQLSKPAVPNNNAILEITKGSMPSTENQAVVVLWLGLGSIADPGEVLAANQAPLTFLGEVYQDQHIMLKAASKTHEHAPHFLEWREDYHEGSAFSEINGKLQSSPLVGSLSLGFTNSIYNVSAWTNLMGLSFPKESELKIFLPSKERNSMECRIACSVIINSIDMGSADAHFKPLVEAKTTVNDRRLEGDGTNVASSYYLTLDGGLLSPLQAANKPHYKVSPNQPQSSPSIVGIRTIFLVIFCFLFVAPLFLFFLKRKNSAKTTTNHK